MTEEEKIFPRKMDIEIEIEKNEVKEALFSTEDIENEFEKKLTDNFRINYQTAENEFYRFADAWKIDVYTHTMTDKQEEDFEDAKRKIVLQICYGKAEVDENGDIIYQLITDFKDKKTLHFKRPSGRHWQAMDNISDRKSMKKMLNFFAAALGVVPATLTKLDGIDMRMVQAVYLLFLGS